MIKVLLVNNNCLSSITELSMLNMPQSLTQISESENGNIYETNCFKDGLFFIQQFSQLHPGKRKMAALDLDNTVVSYRHTLGTDQWFDFDFNAFMEQGLTVAQTKDSLLPKYFSIVKNIHPDDIYVVEEDTPAVIRKMQEDQVETIALTSRGSHLLQETIDQLARFQIGFNCGAYAGTDKKLPPSEEGLFTQGMILTAGQHKGQCLLTALEQFVDLPDFIIMWDDKLNNLERVRASIKEYNDAKRATNPNFVPVQFVGIRYSKLDHLINSVDPRVIELQKRYFQRIISDEHAAVIIKAEQKKSRQHFVNIDFQPQEDKIVISINKAETYKKLLNLCPDLDTYQIKSIVKAFYGKEKLAMQFEFTIEQFEPLFHHLSQHGLIEASQFALLDPIFHRSSAAVVPYQQMQAARAREEVASAAELSVLPLGNLSLTDSPRLRSV